MEFCCEGFKKWVPKFDWFSIEKSVALMPNIDGLRVNHCPCCGAEVRNIEVPYDEYLSIVSNNKNS